MQSERSSGSGKIQPIRGQGGRDNWQYRPERPHPRDHHGSHGAALDCATGMRPRHAGRAAHFSHVLAALTFLRGERALRSHTRQHWSRARIKGEESDDDGGEAPHAGSLDGRPLNGK